MKKKFRCLCVKLNCDSNVSSGFTSCNQYENYWQKNKNQKISKMILTFGTDYINDINLEYSQGNYDVVLEPQNKYLKDQFYINFEKDEEIEEVFLKQNLGYYCGIKILTNKGRKHQFPLKYDQLKLKEQNASVPDKTRQQVVKYISYKKTQFIFAMEFMFHTKFEQEIIQDQNSNLDDQLRYKDVPLNQEDLEKQQSKEINSTSTISQIVQEELKSNNDIKGLSEKQETVIIQNQQEKQELIENIQQCKKVDISNNIQVSFLSLFNQELIYEEIASDSDYLSQIIENKYQDMFRNLKIDIEQSIKNLHLITSCSLDSFENDFFAQIFNIERISSKSKLLRLFSKDSPNDFDLQSTFKEDINLLNKNSLELAQMIEKLKNVSFISFSQHQEFLNQLVENLKLEKEQIVQTNQLHQELYDTAKKLKKENKSIIQEIYSLEKAQQNQISVEKQLEKQFIEIQKELDYTKLQAQSFKSSKNTYIKRSSPQKQETDLNLPEQDLEDLDQLERKIQEKFIQLINEINNQENSQTFSHYFFLEQSDLTNKNLNTFQNESQKYERDRIEQFNSEYFKYFFITNSEVKQLNSSNQIKKKGMIKSFFSLIDQLPKQHFLIPLKIIQNILLQSVKQKQKVSVFYLYYASDIDLNYQDIQEKCQQIAKYIQKHNMAAMFFCLHHNQDLGQIQYMKSLFNTLNNIQLEDQGYHNMKLDNKSLYSLLSSISKQSLSVQSKESQQVQSKLKENFENMIKEQQQIQNYKKELLLKQQSLLNKFVEEQLENQKIDNIELFNAQIDSILVKQLERIKLLEQQYIDIQSRQDQLRKEENDNKIKLDDLKLRLDENTQEELKVNEQLYDMKDQEQEEMKIIQAFDEKYEILSVLLNNLTRLEYSNKIIDSQLKDLYKLIETVNSQIQNLENIIQQNKEDQTKLDTIINNSQMISQIYSALINQVKQILSS